MRFTSTPRGARLARRLLSHRLNNWGHPYTTQANETLTLITRRRGAPVHHVSLRAANAATCSAAGAGGHWRVT